MKHVATVVVPGIERATSTEATLTPASSFDGAMRLHPAAQGASSALDPDAVYPMDMVVQGACGRRDKLREGCAGRVRRAGGCAALAGCVGTRLKALALERGIVFDECTLRVEGAVNYDKPSLVAVRLDIEFDTRESMKNSHVYGSKEWTELVEGAETLSPVAQLVRRAYPHRATPRLSAADDLPSTTVRKPTPGIEDDVIPAHEKDTGADEFRVYWSVRSV